MPLFLRPPARSATHSFHVASQEAHLPASPLFSLCLLCTCDPYQMTTVRKARHLLSPHNSRLITCPHVVSWLHPTVPPYVALPQLTWKVEIDYSTQKISALRARLRGGGTTDSDSLLLLLRALAGRCKVKRNPQHNPAPTLLRYRNVGNMDAFRVPQAYCDKEKPPPTAVSWWCRSVTAVRDPASSRARRTS